MSPLFASSARAQIPADLRSQLERNGHALLIGASAYGSNTGWTPLRSVTANLNLLQEALTLHFLTVTKLENPTAASLQERLREFLLNRAENNNSRLFVYYAGHGFTILDVNRREEIGYITGIDSIESSRDERRAVQTSVSMDIVDTLFRQANTRHVIGIFDSCFSGSIFETRGPATNLRATFDSLRESLRHPVRFYISAGGSNQRVPEPSPIVDLFIKGLSGDADYTRDGIISGTELGMYLRDQAPRFSGNVITPQFGATTRSAALARGEFLFLSGLNSLQRRLPAPTVTQPPQHTRIVFPADPSRFLLYETPTRWLEFGPDFRIPLFTPLPEIPPISTSRILFARNSSNLEESAVEILRSISSFAIQQNSSRIDLFGFIEPGEQGVSVQRARKTADTLIKMGLERTRIVGFDCIIRSEYVLNVAANEMRRVEIVVRA